MRRSLPATCLIAAAALLGAHGVAEAQLKGDYIPGFVGLESGSQASPGISLFLPVYVYTSSTIEDDAGHGIGNSPHITSGNFGPGVLWVTNTTVLGGHWGGQVAPAFAKSRIESNSPAVPSSFAFTDMYIQPFQLGWGRSRADMVIGWGFFLPTGKWKLGGEDNSGLGMWSNDFQVGTTLRLDRKQAWATSMLGTYEIHSNKADTDVRVGDILTLEGGTGKAFSKEGDHANDPQVTNLGIVYYAQIKVTSDTGTGALSSGLLAGRKDRVFGAGAEGSLSFPKSKLSLNLRLMPEFGARNRTEGFTSVLTIAYEAKSFRSAPD